MSIDTLTDRQKHFIETFILSSQGVGPVDDDIDDADEMDVGFFGDLFASKPKTVSTLMGQTVPKMKDLLATAGKTSTETQKNDLIANSAAAKGSAKDAAEKAFADFDKITGGGAITSKTVKEADKTLKKSLETLKKAEAALKSAKTEKAKTKATKALGEAKTAADDARVRLDALVGTLMLKTALTDGPLAGKGGPAMPDAAVAALIEGFAVNPALTWQTLDLAAEAIDPTAMAKAIPAVSSQMASGFVDAKGNPPPETLDVKDYALQVLRMGGSCGADYFDRLDGYVASGGLNDKSPLPDAKGDALSLRCQKRSAQAATSLLNNGAFDADSDSAKKGLGHLLFHPDSMATPTPALNAHMLKTLHVFTDGSDATQANKELEDATAPKTAAGRHLVAQSTAAGGTPSKADTQTAILTSMLQPVDQGPVGSCFATAPLRRMRESDPLTTLRKFREMAEDGTFTTASGSKTPAVTNLPPGEDPLIRGLEYTIATAMGRDASMSLKKKVNKKAQSAAFDLQQELLKNKTLKNVGSTSVKLLSAVKTGFAISYDPMVENPATASDGKSSRGRYVLQAPDGTVIDSRDKYRDAVLEMAMTAFGNPTDKKERKAITDAVDKNYMKYFDDEAAKDPPVKPPWSLKSGGVFSESLTTVHGSTTPVNAVAKAPGKSDTPEKVGARTADVLCGLADNFGATPPDMLLVQTPGIHGFNLLPNDPSMVELLKGAGTTSQKVDDKLVKPGKALATTALDLGETLRQYDRCVRELEEIYQSVIDDPSHEPGVKKQLEKCLKSFLKNTAKNAPKTGLKPKEIAAAVKSQVKGLKRDYVEGVLQRKLATGLSKPQIVLADTNWGDGTEHVYFIVAPDPMTGEPMLWQKSSPGGDMRLMPESWIDNDWQIMK